MAVHAYITQEPPIRTLSLASSALMQVFLVSNALHSTQGAGLIVS